MSILKSNEEILYWIEEKNKNLKVAINKKDISQTNWFLDEDGVIRNEDNTFFQIKGIKKYNSSNNMLLEQPILIQDEIGYLGIICKNFDGTMFFLMQAKIEPGNINKIQIQFKSKRRDGHEKVFQIYILFFIYINCNSFFFK